MNIASRVSDIARLFPNQPAVMWTDHRGAHGLNSRSRWTFGRLEDEVHRLAHGLRRIGVRRGMRTIVMVRPGPDFFALTFALFRIGAVPVLIDPGMGKRNMVRCLAGVDAEAFIGISLAHVLRKLFPASFRTVRIVVTAGRRWVWGGHRICDLRAAAGEPYEPAATRPDDTAAILFTTGSTGPPKGVVYHHATFDAQVHQLRSQFGLAPGQVDLATFPLFALFDAALGVTAVIPDMDPTRPGFVNPRTIIRTIEDHAATNMFASPALLERVGRFGVEHGVRLPTLRRVISAGAPVAPPILERFLSMLTSDARIYTPYGATESLPVASISSGEILSDTGHRTAAGAGTCVGRPVEGTAVRIIRIDDGPISDWSDALVLPDGEIGEIAVNGPVVTTEYFANPAATRLAKVHDGPEIWHRMGDVGYFDSAGRLWFCGRKAHRVITQRGTLFTDPCEAIFNQHPAIRRTALVGVGAPPRQRPVLCVEPKSHVARHDRAQMIVELLRLGRANPLTAQIDTILFRRSFPVDIRHNAKIFRETLAAWATRRLSGQAQV